MISRFSSAILLSVLLMASQAAQAQVSSIRLSDTVASSGRGSIDLLRNVTASQLEAYRQQHLAIDGRHYLSFGVDVNEAAKGLEKSSAQGVTVALAQLTVVRAGVSTIYSDYMTRTQALLRPAGSTQRSSYYTLLGEGGSSRITSGNAIQSQFDSTLNLFVPDDLSTVTSASLLIRFLDVNQTVGEPEAFYDYSGGFEDLALLNNTDAKYLNTTLVQNSTFASEAPAAETTTLVQLSGAVAPPEPTVVSWSYFPSASQWYMVAYEDNYPARSDYDFNDLVVGYRYRYGLSSTGQLLRIDGEAYIVARGAAYSHDWNLKFPLPAGASGRITCSVTKPGATALPCANDGVSFSGAALVAGFSDTRTLLPDGGSAAYPWAVNTVSGQAFRQGPKLNFSVTTTAVDPTQIGGVDPWLQVRDTNQAIHLSEIDPTQKDANGFPFALLLPSDWQPPAENTDLGLAYPEFADFVRSSGMQNRTWFLRPDASRVIPAVAGWTW
jgi:LruC domain-containing protein